MDKKYNTLKEVIEKLKLIPFHKWKAEGIFYGNAPDKRCYSTQLDNKYVKFEGGYWGIEDRYELSILKSKNSKKCIYHIETYQPEAEETHIDKSEENLYKLTKDLYDYLGKNIREN
jgi:hypothetical protein